MGFVYHFSAMKYFLIAFFAVSYAITGRAQNANADLQATLSAEIVEVERQFMDMLNQKGAAEAFYSFAAPDAVIKRGDDELIAGPDAIKTYYAAPIYQNATAEWRPDFIDVANDGSMAYTYGKYRWTITDLSGKTTEYTGVFHTVWKRMEDGSWKYVWD